MEQLYEVLYHYTSLDTFFNIIKTKKFRLCDVTKGNDPLEGVYMLQALEEAYRRLYSEGKINREERFLAHRAFFDFQENLSTQGRFRDFNGAASFCIPTHELLMLRSYADNGKGIALGVPVKVLETLANENEQLEFRKMEYLSKKEIDQCANDFWIRNITRFKNKILETDKKSLSPFVDLIKECYYQSYFLKDKGNEDEQEYRLLFHCEDLFQLRLPSIREDVPTTVDFSVCNGDLKAYYEIDIGDREKTPFYFSDIIIGPQCKVTTVEIQAFLHRHGIRGCSVQKNSWIEMR